MNRLDSAIERILEELVEALENNLRFAKQELARFREQHNHHRKLTEILIGFTNSTEGEHMASTTLTTAGQKTFARIARYLDQNGKEMPKDFTPPLVEFSIDDTAGAVVKVVDNGDNTATVTDVADGTAILTAKTKSAEGLDISASGTITVSNGGTEPPPVPVLTSIELGFDAV